MNIERAKATAFIERLWENPSLAGLSPLQKEEQLNQFLDVNAVTLHPTLVSPKFFPNMTWPIIRKLLGTTLSEFTNNALNPLYNAILEKSVDLSFIQKMLPQQVNPPKVQEQLVSFIRTLSDKSTSRMELAGPLLALSSGFVDRYMSKIFRRQKYVSFELLKVQRLKISHSEITELVKTTMLVRPAVQYFSGEAKNIRLISSKFAGKVAEDTAKMLTLMPEAVVKAGINSTMSFIDNPYLESTARLAAVFTHRCRNMKPEMQVDRGAESSDKSWFSVARKNYKFYGFDLDMLVELHSIAAENEW